MFSIKDQVISALSRGLDNLTDAQRHLITMFADREGRAAARRRAKFSQSYVKVGEIEASAKGGKHKQMIPVLQYVGWDIGKKYTGEKLRQIRQKQALAFVEQWNKENPNQPLDTSRLIDYPQGA